MIARVSLLLAALVLPSLAAAQDSRPTSRPTSRPGDTVPIEPVRSGGGLVFTGQTGWEQLSKTSRMRVVTYRLPGQGEDDAASLVVFYFGGDGGGVDANLERWYGQFSQPDGSSTADAAKREQRELLGMKVHVVDVSGTFVAETSPGSGVHVKKDGYRMLAAIFESPTGSHFVKLVGPAETVARWQESFDTFLAAVEGEF